jgi:hypothetical protein
MRKPTAAFNSLVAFSSWLKKSAFIRAVDKLFGAEQARQSALDWIAELERMDWPSGESIPDWRRATVGASARLGALLSGSGHRDTLSLRPVCSSRPGAASVDREN